MCEDLGGHMDDMVVWMALMMELYVDSVSPSKRSPCQGREGGRRGGVVCVWAPICCCVSNGWLSVDGGMVGRCRGRRGSGMFEFPRG